MVRSFSRPLLLSSLADVFSFHLSMRTASTALEYTRSIRTLTDVLGSTTFVSLCEFDPRFRENETMELELN